jgi:TPR repeat protein
MSLSPKALGGIVLGVAILAGAGFTYKYFSGPPLDPLEAGHTAYLDGDFPTAVKYLQPLSDKGNPQAQDDMANLHYSGHFVSQDYDAALKLFKQSAQQGNIDAQNNLGMMYASGKGVTKDLAESAKWYLKAAQQGSGLAQDLVANDYEYGWGVPQDLVAAYMWFAVANAGNEDPDYQVAAQTLGSLATQMTPEQIAQAQHRASAFHPEPSPNAGTMPAAKTLPASAPAAKTPGH